MQCANILTGEISPALPSILMHGGGNKRSAKLDQWSRLGWRQVVEMERPARGFRVERYEPEEIDGLSCRLRVLTQVGASAEAADQVAVDAAAAQRLLELSSGDMGSTLRALAWWMLDGISPLARRRPRSHAASNSL